MSTIRLRGVRGATSVELNDAAQILDATEELLGAVLRENRIDPEDLATIFFTVTDDLNAAFPAAAARRMGLSAVPLLCSREIPVATAPPRIIRVLLLWHTALGQKDLKHIYLGRAKSLRRDLTEDASPLGLGLGNDQSPGDKAT